MCLLISKVIILLCKLLNLQESIPYFDVFVSEINLFICIFDLMWRVMILIELLLFIKTVLYFSVFL